LDAVTIADAGSHLVISGTNRDAVQAALNRCVTQGARTIAEPTRLGSKWIASCEKPPESAERKAPGAVLADTTEAAVLKAVKVANAGSHLILTATDKAMLEQALQYYVKRGAKVKSGVASLGNQWVATCHNPTEPEESCTVERMGFQIVITGSSERVVREKVQSLAIGGAKLVAPIDRFGEKWVAVCDTRS